MRHLVLVFVALLSACGLILDNSPPDPLPLGLGDASVDSCASDADCLDPCFASTACVEGLCVREELMDCSELDVGLCIRGVCVQGECMAKADGGLCDDGIECTVGVCSETGTCSYEASHELCDDGIGCTKDMCAPGDNDGGSGCVHFTSDEACAGRVSLNGCLASVCGGSETEDGSGCLTVLQPDKCNADSYCSVETGHCTTFATSCENNTQCNDGNECNGEELCLEGKCYAGTSECPTGINPCYEPVCIDGACGYRIIEECVIVEDPLDPNPVPLPIWPEVQ
jgi:hypothetical protein